MIGILIVTHKELAEALMSIYDMILGPREGIGAVSLDPNAPPEASRSQIQRALAQVNNGGGGVIILTDMLGGTPSNLTLPFLEEGKVEVITGVNLPMLMKLSQIRDLKDLREAAAALKLSGQKGITVASEVLHKKEK
jgi:PTS system mannose-specific IIA component